MKTCGIYNIVSKIDGKIYIGSSNDVNRRYYIHRYGKKDSKETIERKTNSHVKTDHFFISPENTIVNIRNLRKFCDENNLNQGAMYGIYKGRINIHKGWRRYENHNN